MGLLQITREESVNRLKVLQRRKVNQVCNSIDLVALSSVRPDLVILLGWSQSS